MIIRNSSFSNMHCWAMSVPYCDFYARNDGIDLDSDFSWSAAWCWRGNSGRSRCSLYCWSDNWRSDI